MTVIYLGSGAYEVEVRGQTIILYRHEVVEMVQELDAKGMGLDYLEEMNLEVLCEDAK